MNLNLMAFFELFFFQDYLNHLENILIFIFLDFFAIDVDCGRRWSDSEIYEATECLKLDLDYLKENYKPDFKKVLESHKIILDKNKSVIS